jgi:alkyldihydroxyacetonephosphate synthase
MVSRELEAVVGAEHVSRDAEARARQAADWSWMAQFFAYAGEPLPMAEIVVSPCSADEVEDVVRVASDYRIPVVPRGGGSGTQGGTLAPYGGIALDLTRMNQVRAIDEQSLIVTGQAGVDGLALERQLNERDLTLAHYPGSLPWGATLAGYVAARGSGVVSTKYGKAEDMVLSAEAVVPPGKRVSTLPVPNHAAGPDLLGPLVGSEGTLGVITELSMRLDPLPEARRFLSFRFPDVFTGIEAGRQIMTQRWRPAVIRLYEEADTAKLSNMLDLGIDGVLMLVVCDGAEELAELEAKAIEGLCAGQGGTSLGPTAAETWWDGKYEPFAAGNAPAPPQVFGTTDTAATYERLPDLYRAKRRAIEEGFAELGARYTAHFSHWYRWGAMIYDRFYVDHGPEDPYEALALHDRLWDAAVTAALEQGGIINDHHGVGLKLGRFMRAQHGAAFELLQKLKGAWDPDGIMNPGKLGLGPPRGGSGAGP